MIAWRAWQRLLHPDQMNIVQEPPIDLLPAFRELRPQARTAAGYLRVMNTIASHCSELDNKAEHNIVKFVDLFYEERAKLRDDNYDQWIKINPPYKEVIKEINYWLSRISVYVVSVKDKKSISNLLANYQLYIEGNNIFAEPELDKFKALQLILNNTYANPRKFVYIDDHPHNLQLGSSLGIQLILASWGYVPLNGKEKAQQVGAHIATLDNLHDILTTILSNKH